MRSFNFRKPPRDQPQRFLGISLANCNVVISLALAAVALWGLRANKH